MMIHTIRKISLRRFLIVALALLGVGCSHYSKEPQMTQLQIREIQTSTFSSVDAKTVLKEMINVLQDESFIVKNANHELGILSGEKDVQIEERGVAHFFNILANGKDATWSKNAITEVSANVTQFGGDTRVRVNFQLKIFDNFGRVIEVKQIYDPSYYQSFFNKVHKGLFIHQEKI
jgi:hypothetical protein